MKEKLSHKKIRLVLLIIAGWLIFYGTYFFIWGFSVFKIQQTNQIRKYLSEDSLPPREIVSKTFHLLLLDTTEKEKNLWNLASAYYKLNQYHIALRFYDSLYRSAQSAYWQVRAKAQIANLLYINSHKMLDSALLLYKQALYQMENNENIRYNYELLKKISQKSLLTTQKISVQPSSLKLPDTLTEQTPSYKKEANNELLEAITNQEKELFQKYLNKKSFVSSNNYKSLPDW